MERGSSGSRRATIFSQMRMEACMGLGRSWIPAATYPNACSLLVHWTCLIVVSLRRTTFNCNAIEGCSGLHSSSSSDISESVFCIASGQYTKSEFDWQQETPTQRSAVVSTAQSLHSRTLPRLDTLGFHYREGVSNHISLVS